MMQSNSYNTNGNNNQQTRTPDIDPRAILIKKYSNTKKNFTDELPKDIFEKLFSSEGSVCSDLYDPELDKDKQIISTIFKDNRITLEQKEQISKSILNGNYEIFNHYDKNSYNNSYNNSYSNNSYNNNNNNSKSMNDLNQTQNSLAKSKYEINLHRHKLPKPKFLELVGEQKLNNQNSATFVSRKDVRNEYIKRIVNSSPRRPKKPLLSPKSIKKDSKEFNYATELPKKIQSERQRILRETKEEMDFHKSKIEMAKEEEQESIKRKAFITKKLREFRQKLKVHLEEIKNPMKAQIMKAVSEDMLYHFMEKFHGYSMSVETVLALLGGANGTAVVNPDKVDLTHSDTIYERRYGGSREGRSLSPLQRRNFPTLENTGNPAEHALNSSDSIYFPPKKYAYFMPSSSVHNEMTLGSGFRVLSPKNKARKSTSQSSFDFDRSRSIPPKHENINVFGSDILKTMEMTGLYDNHRLDGRTNTSKDDESVGTEQVIQAMRDQLIEEDILPSLKPEKIFSLQQLEDIGTHKKLVDEVIVEMETNKIKRPKNLVIPKESNTFMTDNLDDDVLDAKSVDGSVTTKASVPSLSDYPNIEIIDSALPAITEASAGKAVIGVDDLNLEGKFVHSTTGMIADDKEVQEFTLNVIEETKNGIEVNTDGKVVSTSGNGFATGCPNSVSSSLEGSILQGSISPENLIIDTKSFRRIASGKKNSSNKNSFNMFEGRDGSASLLSGEGHYDQYNNRSQLTKGTIGIKTKTLNREADGLDFLPQSPYKSFAETSRVINSGVPAGSGFMLWRPKREKTPNGRYRAGVRGKLSSLDLKDDSNYKYNQRPFISSI